MKRKSNQKVMTYQKMARALGKYTRTGEMPQIQRKLTCHLSGGYSPETLLLPPTVCPALSGVSQFKPLECKLLFTHKWPWAELPLLLTELSHSLLYQPQKTPSFRIFFSKANSCSLYSQVPYLWIKNTRENCTEHVHTFLGCDNILDDVYTILVLKGT